MEDPDLPVTRHLPDHAGDDVQSIREQDRSVGGDDERSAAKRRRHHDDEENLEKWHNKKRLQRGRDIGQLG